MPYILNKTDGTALTTLADASLDTSTSLTFVGRNYAGYGETVNENFLKLLENFANKTQPPRPIRGQLWFDTTSKQLTVSRDGKNFTGIAVIDIQESEPLHTKLLTGDLWWNKTAQQLNVYNGSDFVMIGPVNAANANWTSLSETVNGEDISSLRGNIDQSTVAILSNNDFTPESSSALFGNFGNGVKKGLTLSGADENGSTIDSGHYFWGTAAEALTCANVTVDAPFLIQGDGIVYPTLATSPSGSQQLITAAGSFYYDINASVLHTTASAALFADLAERYEADKEYDVGTVLVIGGSKEVTTTDVRANPAVAGVVSKDPAYRMNCGAGTDETHPYVALKGRVPCKIKGNVNKGDLLVSSDTPGYAEVMIAGDNPHAVIGKALENFEGLFGVIEIKI